MTGHVVRWLRLNQLVGPARRKAVLSRTDWVGTGEVTWANHGDRNQSRDCFSAK